MRDVNQHQLIPKRIQDWFEQAVNHTANTDFAISHTYDTVR